MSQGRRLLKTAPQVTGAKGSSLLCLKGFPGTPLHRRGPEVWFPGQQHQPPPGSLRHANSQATAQHCLSKLQWIRCKPSWRCPPQFRQKAFLEKIPLTHHISDDVRLTSSNDLCGRITIWDSYDRTLTNSGDSGTLGCSTALARREERETEDCLYTGPPELEPRGKGSLLTFKWLHQKSHE